MYPKNENKRLMCKWYLRDYYANIERDLENENS